MSEPPPASPPPQRRRRSSFVDMFTSRSTSSNNVSSSPPTNQATSTSAMPAHHRGMSITTMGLTGNANGQNGPFNAFARQRRASVATSSASGSPEFKNNFGDEPAVIEEDDTARVPPNSSASFGRRLSFGAQALREVKQGSGPGSPGAGRRPSSFLSTLDEDNGNNLPSRPVSSGKAKTPGKDRGLPPANFRILSPPSPTSKIMLITSLGEGFNWSEALRDRSKRSPSFTSGNPFASNSNRPRATSSGASDAPPPPPPQEMPKTVETPRSRMRKPDHLGERMLRGDFMMD